MAIGNILAKVSTYYASKNWILNSAVSNKAAESGYEGKRIAHVYRQSKTTPQTAIVVCKFHILVSEVGHCFRTIKHVMTANSNYPILSVVVIGTFGIIELNSSNDYDSSFNVRNPLQNPNLSKEPKFRLKTLLIFFAMQFLTDMLLWFAFAENTSQTAMYAKNLVHLILAKILVSYIRQRKL
ncbi:12690_t:CDS:2 [Funneliformis mosseae]|uniref:12690_t:CDS:1 n=1 Tax=Funneliformis mosseae TaxID=27381 RepID=A0A9N9GPE6_FUNMO|nr:12690_t:CDS:2 [Funneliformis mosseae]